MPGYRMLGEHVEGELAGLVREAEERQQEGDLAAAATLFERAIERAAESSDELPAWACGRLAAVYRGLARYDDEVALLERYCDSCRTEDARVRFVARLSKARAIAERARRRDSGALRAVQELTVRLRGSSRAVSPDSPSPRSAATA